MKKQTAAITAPKKLLVQITPELRLSLDAIAESTEESLGEVVERLLRESSEVDSARRSLKLAWFPRPVRGNFSRVAKKVLRDA